MDIRKLMSDIQTNLFYIYYHRSFQPALIILAQLEGDIPTTHGDLTGWYVGKGN